MGTQGVIRKLVPGMGGEAGVHNVLDLLADAGVEVLGDAKGILAMLAHAEVEGLCAALGEPAVEGGGDGTDGVLEEAQAVGQLGMVLGEDETAHEDVGVAVDVLCEGVGDDVGAVEEGRGIVGREEGVVDEDEGVRGRRAGDGDDAFERDKT